MSTVERPTFDPCGFQYGAHQPDHHWVPSGPPCPERPVYELLIVGKWFGLCAEHTRYARSSFSGVKSVRAVAHG